MTCQKESERLSNQCKLNHMPYIVMKGALLSNKVQSYFLREGINHSITRSHAPLAERMIRTIQDMIYKRVEGLNDPILTNRLRTVSKITMINIQAGLLVWLQVVVDYQNTERKLEMNAKRHREYPNVSIDDKVRLFRKKDRFDTERHGIWSRYLPVSYTHLTLPTKA